MGSGWHEWPRTIFTVFGQSVAGALIVCGLAWMRERDGAAKTRIVRSMLFLWVVMGIGFAASVLHLGASALSNEIAAGSLFFAVGGFWWLIAVIGKMPSGPGKVWLALSQILGLVFVWTMTRVYQIATVPTWHTGYTTLAFFLTMALSGPLLAVLVLRAWGSAFTGAKNPRPRRGAGAGCGGRTDRPRAVLRSAHDRWNGNCGLTKARESPRKKGMLL